MANEFIAHKGLIALDNSGISGSLDVSGSLSINGISDVSASIASAAAGGGSDFPYTGSAIISGSLEVIGKITGSILIESSGSTLFEVVGSEGQLFSITDSLSGSLFAVSDVSGLPILEVFSDDTVKIGSFNNEAIIVEGSTAIVSGSFSGSFEGDGSGLTGIPTVNTSSLVTTSSFNTFTSSYYNDSASFDGRINNINIDTSYLVTTSSFNSFTSSIQSEVDNITAQTGSYVLTSSFNTFTSSYYTDSASFDTRINNITFDTSSLVTTSSFNQFTSSYNTGSFVGSLFGTSSWAQSASSAISAQTASTIAQSTINDIQFFNLFIS